MSFKIDQLQCIGTAVNRFSKITRAFNPFFVSAFLLDCLSEGSKEEKKIKKKLLGKKNAGRFRGLIA